MGAYMGKILMVDLGAAKCEVERPSDAIYEQYLGGQGLAAWINYSRIPAGADPLGPDNIIGFVPGLLTGTGSLFTGRWTVTGKSPLTGGWGDANCGGTLAPAIKHAGFDGIFVRGISDKPVYLYVKNGRAEIRDAADLWGKDAVEAEEMLLERHGPTARVALIGPAGENVSLISGVCNDRGRIAARSGLGAVMGAKRLKAVVCEGALRIPVADRPEMKRLSKKLNKWVSFQPPAIPGSLMAFTGWLLGKIPIGFAVDGMLYKYILKTWGTAGLNQMSIGWGDSPIRNWKGSFEDFGIKSGRWNSVNGDRFTDCEMAKYHCYSCPLGCGGFCRMDGKYAETHKPEYETVLALGGLCMNEDRDSLFYLNEVLNRAGMDSISAGGTVAFAIECFEKGIFTTADTDGLELTWGNTEAIVALVHKMVNREGIGDLLADGSKVAAKRLGKDTINWAVQAGGQEPAMHDGRMDPGFALHYCVEPTPGRHTLGAQIYYEMFHLWKKVKGLPASPLVYTKNHKYVMDGKKIKASVAQSKFMSLANSTGFCLFGLFIGVERIPVFEWINAATGWNKTPDEYMAIGERVQTLKQAFNIKQGIEPVSNKLSARALGMPPLVDGPNKGRTIDIDNMMQDYWAEFGWDSKGHPSTATLRRLGLDAL